MLIRSFIIALLAVFSGAVQASAQDRPAFWVDMKLGEPVSTEEMLEDLAEVDVIYLGETHRLERHHRLQAEIVRELAKSGRPLILGLEQIEGRDQEEVDRYNEGKVDFKGLAKAIEWEKQWNNYEDYREIIEAAHGSGGRVVGLNGPREVIRSVGKSGVDGLSKEDRVQLPEEIFLDDPVYEKLMETLLLVHMTMEKGFLRKVFEAQAARDESMAAAIAEGWRDAPGKGDGKKPIAIVICGAGHCESGDLELTESEKAMMREMEIRHRDVDFIDRPIADYLHAMEPKPEDEEEAGKE
jgi:uncharacterized iron-regulated protein